MKKPILFCLLILSMIITSCSKDENESNVQNEEVSLVGVWLWQSETIDGDSIELDSCEAQFTLTFDSNSNFIDNQPYSISGECTDDIANGTYSIDGTNISFVYEGEGSTTNEQDFEISDDILTLTHTNEEGENVATFKKM